MDRRTFIGSSALMALGIPGAADRTDVQRYPDRDDIRVGIIGVGVRGRQLMRAMVDHVDGMDITAICDVLEANLETGHKLVGKRTKHYYDYQNLLEDKSIDAVFIATPLYLHHPVAMDAIDAGKHIYCEKTMAYDIDGTLELWRAALGSPLVFQVGYQERHNPLFKQVSRLISNGACGKITYIDCQWNRNGDWRRPVSDPDMEKLVNWRMYKAYSGGLMAELCSHQIDLVNWFTRGYPLRVTGMGGIDYWQDGRETFDNVTAIYDYEGGIKARFTALTTNAREGFCMKFYGTKATIEINRENDQQAFIFPETPPDRDLLNIDGLTGATEPASWLTGGIPILVDGAHSLADSTINAIREFRDCIRQQKPPVSNAHTAALSSIAVHMANDATTNDKTAYWKTAYEPLKP